MPAHKQNNPLVSVVIPTFRRTELLKRAIKSVFAQTYSNWELIVSDDDPAESKSWRYLVQLSQNYEQIQIFKNEGPSGQVGNTNNVLRQSNGEWIKILHDDDVLKPTCLTELVDVAEHYSQSHNIACVTCGVERHFTPQFYYWERRNGWPSVELIPQDQILTTMYMGEDAGGAAPSQKMIHRSVIESGVFMEDLPGLRLLVDSWFNARIGQTGDLLIYRKPLVEWHQGEHFTQSSGWMKEEAEEELYLLRELLWEIMPCRKYLPEPEIMKQVFALQRGLWRLKHRQIGIGLRLLSKVKKPDAIVEYGRWMWHNLKKGNYGQGKRIPLDWSSAIKKQVGNGSQSKTPGSSIKIGFYVFFPGGGIGRYTHVLAEFLSRRKDLSVEIMCSPDFKWNDSSATRTWPGLKSISHDVSPIRRFLFLWGQFINPMRCIRHAIKNDLDVIHFSNINHLSFPYWHRALRGTGIKMTATVHDVKRQKSILSRYWEVRQLKSFYQAADALFVHSQYQATELVKFAHIQEEKIHIVPHGPYSHGDSSADRESVRKFYNVPQKAQVALFFGQIRDEKNLDQLLKAVMKSESKPHLIIAGHGGSRHRDLKFYKQLASRLGLSENITFIPHHIPDQEVSNLFEAADWIVLPYRKDFTSQSGVLNVAAHYRRPVLVSSAPVLKETVQLFDIGVISKGDDADSLARGIDEINKRISGNYDFKFDHYRRMNSWEENVSRTAKVYKMLLDSAVR